jgi:toluene monooxygenase system protein E
MARSSWSYLKGEKRTGEYEELTVRSIGHWWMKDDPAWPEVLRDGYHLSSETGIAMIEPTALITSDSAAYRDRFKLTYRSYVLQQDGEEKKLDAIVEGAKKRGAFAETRIPLPITRQYIPAMRHYFWGSGMMQIYGATYTPYGPVMNSLLFQIFDSMRHAQRLVELSWELNHGIAEPVDSHAAWLDWQPVQPLRKFIEHGLSVFDWAETFVALNFILDPIFLPMHDVMLVDIAEHEGDWAIAQFWLVLAEDMMRHMVSGADFVAAMLKESEHNLAIVQKWLDRWYPMAVDVLEGLRPLIDDANRMGFPKRFEQLKTEILTRYADSLIPYGLTVPVTHGETYESEAGFHG